MTHEDELPEPQRARLTRPSTPGQKAAGWMTWHAGELAAVAGPSLLAVAVTPWAWVATAVSAGAWAVHEARHAHARRALQHEQATEDESVTSTNEETTAATGASEHEQIEVRHG